MFGVIRINEQIIVQLIYNMLDNGEKIIITDHADKRMNQRGIDYDDIVKILKNPSYIQKETESESYAGKFNYRIVGENGWSVVVSIDYPEKIIVVTVID